MTRELKNAKIGFVSYVDKAANKHQFFLTKSAGSPTFEKNVKLFINKADEAQKLVYGLVYEPGVEDSQGDYMEAEEIEKAAHGFLKDARNIDEQHDFKAGVGEIVESYIAPTDFEIGDQKIAKGAWVLVTKASDDVWEKIQKGDITGYSMAGTAEAIEKNDSESSNNHQDDEMTGFFNTLKSFFSKSKITKGVVSDRYQQGFAQRNFWAAQDALNSALFSWDSYADRRVFETDPDKIKEALTEFSAIVQEILASEDIVKAMGEPPTEIAKAGKAISSANMKQIKAAYKALGDLIQLDASGGDGSEVKKEDFEKVLGEKLDPITKRLDAIEKADKGIDEQDDDSEEEKAIMKSLSDLLDGKLQPINDRLDAVEKSRGISRQSEPKEEDVTKSEDASYMRLFH